MRFNLKLVLLYVMPTVALLAVVLASSWPADMKVMAAFWSVFWPAYVAAYRELNRS